MGRCAVKYHGARKALITWVFVKSRCTTTPQDIVFQCPPAAPSLYCSNYEINETADLRKTRATFLRLLPPFDLAEDYCTSNRSRLCNAPQENVTFVSLPSLVDAKAFFIFWNSGYMSFLEVEFCMTAEEIATTLECPLCKENIHEDAIACKHCGATRKFGGSFRALGWVFTILSGVGILVLIIVGLEAALFILVLMITVPTTIWAFFQAKKHDGGVWYR
jgi:hypothetical protein